MKLILEHTSLEEEIENIGKKDKPFQLADTFKPMTYGDFQAVASVSYADAIEAVMRWREAANKKLAERREFALKVVEADQDDRFKHMDSKQKKFNSGEKSSLGESLTEEVIRVSDEADKLLIKLTMAGFHDWQQLALDLLDSMSDEQVVDFTDRYAYNVETPNVQFETTEPIKEDFQEDEVQRYSAENIEEFEPWQGAIRVWQALQEAGKMSQFKDMISTLYPDEIDAQTLNDLLWFDSDFVFQSVGMTDPLDDDNSEDKE